jgi:septal ring factor EnvC (AmiA/AmiB activator)
METERLENEIKQTNNKIEKLKKKKQIKDLESRIKELTEVLEKFDQETDEQKTVKQEKILSNYFNIAKKHLEEGLIMSHFIALYYHYSTLVDVEKKLDITDLEQITYFK